MSRPGGFPTILKRVTLPLPELFFDEARMKQGMVTQQDIAVQKEIAAILHFNYPGHGWVVECKHDQGVASIKNIYASTLYGMVIHLNNITNAKARRALVVKLGGELLERFGLPRGKFNAQDYEHIWKLGREYKTTDTTEAKRLVI
mgnify:CR=1 FL=1